MSTEEVGATYLLTLRSERPIEGCELSPNAFLALKGGNTDNSTRAKLLEKTPYRFSFSWSKGPKRAICCNSSCPRANTYAPMHWSKAHQTSPELICSVCERQDVPIYDSCYCSVSCFRAGWHLHASSHKCVPSKKKRNNNSFGSGLMLDDVSAADAASNNIAWTKICSEKTYIPMSSDVGCRFKVEVCALSIADNAVLAGPIVVCTEAVLSLPSAPPKRRLIGIPGAIAGMSGAVRFRVISYNILADLYATKQAYPYCDTWSLVWPYRRKLIQAELEELQGDIVCLQEVQQDHYNQDINPFMTQLGYDGVYRAKSRDYGCGFGKVDGCATFWKRNKFIMTENYTIEFNEIARGEAINLGLEEQEARKFMNRLNKDNIATIIVLEALNSRNRSSMCIVNTHLYSNMVRSDVKLWQTRHLTLEVQRFAVPRDLPVMICGDFNSEPTSAVHEFLSTGAIANSRNYPELEVEDGGVRVLARDLRTITHGMELASAMSTVIGREPTFTNYTAKFKGTLDYIWYTPSLLRVMAGANMPDQHELISVSGKGAGLPCVSYPSDHISLCCDVAMVNAPLQ